MCICYEWEKWQIWLLSTEMRQIIRNSTGTKSRVCMQCLLRIKMVEGFVLLPTGVGNHALLQEILPTQGLNQGFLCCRQIIYHLSHWERARWVLNYNLYLGCYGPRLGLLCWWAWRTGKWKLTQRIIDQHLKVAPPMKKTSLAFLLKSGKN